MCPSVLLLTRPQLEIDGISIASGVTTCNTLLDSDANLLLLGDGSLICNNCTHTVAAPVANKIEDLAILTGDQAFCATCFRCRNCKRKIENLRYARTSQGIFCMSCQ